MYDTYYVEERSGVIGLQPLATNPYYRRTKPNWRSSVPWIHLIICLLAVPLIIWNIYHLLHTIELYSDQHGPSNSSAPNSLSSAPPPNANSQTSVHPLGLMIVISAVLMNLLGGVFALVTEAASFSEKLAKFLYLVVYSSIVISILVLLFTRELLGPLWCALLVLFALLFGFGFWRFTIISASYLNEEGPIWYKPLLYGCLAAIPLLSTASQCRETKNLVGCLPNWLFGRHYMFNDTYSFAIMTVIAVVSALPYLFGASSQD